MSKFDFILKFSESLRQFFIQMPCCGCRKKKRKQQQNPEEPVAANNPRPRKNQQNTPHSPTKELTPVETNTHHNQSSTELATVIPLNEEGPAMTLKSEDSATTKSATSTKPRSLTASKTAASASPKEQDDGLYENMDITPTTKVQDDGLYEQFDSIKPQSVAESTTSDGSKPKDWGDYDKKMDYDAICSTRVTDKSTDSSKQQGTVIIHILSQLAIGTDLSKVTLPTFILERRSLLEMYADFFAHPDDFVGVANLNSAEERFLAMVKYYLNSFYPARKSVIAKKPYNPVLGEIFRCRWTLPGTDPKIGPKTMRGPFPGSAFDQVTFIAEQVSHHPPISAFYAEHPAAGITCTTHIYTKSSFYGLSIGVGMIGKATVKLLKHNEDFTFTFPNAYGRSIMSTPWIELGGKVEVRCAKTRYRAEIEFLTKPMIGGTAHHIRGQIYHETGGAKQKGQQPPQKPMVYLKGEWNGRVLMRKRTQNRYQLFTDVREKPEVEKECLPVMKQEDNESRKLWRHVTAALYENNVELATEAKKSIEERQRNEHTKLQKTGEQWQTRFFERVEGHGEEDGDAWRYREDLEERRRGPLRIGAVRMI